MSRPVVCERMDGNCNRYVVRSIEADVSTEKAILLRMNSCHACDDVGRSADTSSCLRSRFGHERWPRRKRPMSLCVPYTFCFLVVGIEPVSSQMNGGQRDKTK